LSIKVTEDLNKWRAFVPKYKVMFCRFPGNHQENPDCTDWFVKTSLKAKGDPRIERVYSWYKSDTPIPMGRNLAVDLAKSYKVDFVVMVDSDMFPDMYLGHDPKAKPFWDTAFDFLTAHNSPAMIAVPYCGPPPVENIYIFKWATQQSDHPNPDLKIDQYTREEASSATGIEEVAALPTGLCMFHLSAIDRIKPPYFYYEWKDERQMEKASTEDVTFTRDLAFAGVPIYVAWDCWAGHWKMKCVGRPGRITVKDVSEKYTAVVHEQIQKAILTTGICPCCKTAISPALVPKFNQPDPAIIQKQIIEAKGDARGVVELANDGRWITPMAVAL
jgi:hypothetical protein